MPLTHTYTENSRGIAVADMAMALRTGRPVRAGAELAYHALEIMLGFEQSSRTGMHYLLKSTCSRPEPMSANVIIGELD